MFTARPDFDREQENRFVEALLAMSYDNPAHRPILEAEGLERWLTPQLDGYADLREAAGQQGLGGVPCQRRCCEPEFNAIAGGVRRLAGRR